MDKGSSSAQRQILVHYTMGPHNRNRCIHQGVGRLFPGDDHGGAWTAAERLSHINYLELSAAFLTLKSFLRDKRKINVLPRMDNVTSIAFINKWVAPTPLPSQILASEITIHAAHLPGTLMYEQTRSDSISLIPVTGCSREMPFSSWSRYGDLSPSTYSLHK